MARVHECVENGVTTFSDVPCGTGDRPITVDYAEPDAADAASAQARIQADNAESDAYLTKIELDRAVSRVQGRISNLQAQRDAELAALRGQMADGAEAAALAGDRSTGSSAAVADGLANIDASLRMEAVNQRYSEDIAIEQQRLETLLQRQVEIDPARMERRELGPKQ
ncbi:MAG: DUF4124 domain-containing protein [Thiohalocapsa sp.]|nr:DUF4124 domain-containing protein [Thiohalocapsa sp.]MCF7991276.1 DUF4124 domain-containing protein [Thiohalocapsa sp.]